MTNIQTIACIGVLAIASVTGCGSDTQETVPVLGQITFDGGACPAEGTIAFSPVSSEDGVPRRPASARFQKDGKFTVTSFKDGDGLLPGRYTPIVSCWLGEPNNKDPGSFERLNAVPRGFKAEEVVVELSNKILNVQIDVPKKK